MINPYMKGIVRSLQFESDRLEGNRPQVEGVGQGLEDGLLGILGSLGQGNAVPTGGQDPTLVWPAEVFKDKNVQYFF